MRGKKERVCCYRIYILLYILCRSSFDYQMQKRAEAEEALKQYVRLCNINACRDHKW